MFLWSVLAFLSQEAQNSMHLSPQTAVHSVLKRSGRIVDLDEVQHHISGQVLRSRCSFSAAREIIFSFLTSLICDLFYVWYAHCVFKRVLIVLSCIRCCFWAQSSSTMFPHLPEMKCAVRCSDILVKAERMKQTRYHRWILFLKCWLIVMHISVRQ